MVDRYGEWDKSKYRIYKRLPWWRKHSNFLVKSSLVFIFFFTFGKSIKMLIFPPPEVKRRSIDPRWCEDKEGVMKMIEKREKAFAKKILEEQARTEK